MDNFQISYNYFKTAFELKSVPFPKELANILEPPAAIITTTQSSSNSTAVNMHDDDDQDNTEDHSLDDSSNSNYSEEYDYPPAPVSVTPASAKGLQENVLDNNNDIQCRRELYKDLYQLVLTKRKQKRLTKKNNETYEWPPIIKQIIRCRYPGDIRDYACYKQVTVSFTLDSFIDLFSEN
ncbi:unnamed protein product [Adineta ricciae]|uniref:Uncharacterized protein n=1 Tax=Adineta ricciae TaxID=249248 RepID=A0A815Z3Z2_ADIRI|nr:unnamed protein product [Adineta ricciae]